MVFEQEAKINSTRADTTNNNKKNVRGKDKKMQPVALLPSMIESPYLVESMKIKTESITILIKLTAIPMFLRV